MIFGDFQDILTLSSVKISTIEILLTRKNYFISMKFFVLLRVRNCEIKRLLHRKLRFIGDRIHAI